MLSHNAGTVRDLQSTENARYKLDRPGRIDLALVNEIPEQPALDELHDDERRLDLVAIGVCAFLFAGVIDAHDRGVSHAS
mgnify:CR=1 FL=1